LTGGEKVTTGTKTWAKSGRSHRRSGDLGCNLSVSRRVYCMADKVSEEDRSSVTEPTGLPALKRQRQGAWLIGLTSFLFILLQSACTAVMAVSGLRLLIGLGSLAAASFIPGFIFSIHADKIRIPMMVVAVLGSVLNLYVVWRIRSLRARPASQWRAQPVTAKERRSETIQIVLSILTLLLVVAEILTHRLLNGSFL